MRETKLFCEKEEGVYGHFYPSKTQVRMCGTPDKNICEVIVREVQSSEQPTHYGWWDNKEEAFSMIYSHRVGVTMCFLYGVDHLEASGEGLVCGLVVTEIRT